MLHKPTNREPTPARGPSAAVHVEGVDVAYDGAAAVDDATLLIEAGSTVSLLGPSGCGKTSLLRAIAGLERPTRGTVQIGDRVVSGPNEWIKPERRSIGMVFQDAALFPHLSVADNIAFGLRSSGRRTTRSERTDRVTSLLRLVDLAGYGDRLPDTLSGGQQQRVALARSLAPNPAVLLLDEPFSALDTGLRTQVRAEVAAILRDVGVTSVFVTHDQDEAFVLGDRVAVMREGRIEQFGTPDELYRAPADPWVAGFVGEANILSAAPLGDGVHAATVLGDIPVADHRAFRGGGELLVLVRPEQLSLTKPYGPDGTPATVVTVEYYGHDVRYELRLDDGASLAARTQPGALFARGDEITVTYDGSPTAAWTAPPT